MIRYVLTACIVVQSMVFAQMYVDTSFEGANAKVLLINNSTNTITIESNKRYKDVHQVTFCLGILKFNLLQPLNIRVQNSNDGLLPVLAAYSYDRVNWSRISGTYVGGYKEYSKLFTQSPVYFATGYPYLYSNLTALGNSLSGNPCVSVTDLTLSEHGRGVKLFRITEPTGPDSGKVLIWVIARSHAMESHSDFAVEGMIQFLSSSAVQAERLRRRAIVYIVPMMDVDQVSAGGTGKDQWPVDFNRDWDAPSYWNAVNGVKQKILQTASTNQLKIFIDSHDPFPGQNDNNTWFYDSYASGQHSVNLDLYRKFFQKNSGYVINRQPMYATAGQTAAFWVDSLFSQIDFSVSLETGWVNRTDKREWTIPLYKTHGENLGKAMSDYVSNIVRSDDIILDNTDTLKGVVISGEWISSENASEHWGTNYLHDNNLGKGSKSVRYSPAIPAPDNYEIFIRWISDANRAGNVPVRITFNGGVKDTVVNQQVSGSEWILLGRYNFAAGTSGSVLIENRNTTAYVIADAVRFSKWGGNTPLSICRNPDQVPAGIVLQQNYPNPFNPHSTITFHLSAANAVKLIVFDILGQEIQTLVNEQLQSGTYTVEFDGTAFTSGVYYYTLLAGVKAETKKMILLK